MRSIRNSAKALIIHDGRLLCTRNEDARGIFYLLPGGGQEPGETIPEALQRECREEIGTVVEVGPLTFVRDYIGKNHEFAAHDADVHQIEYMFAATCPPTRGSERAASPTACRPAWNGWTSRG